MKIGGQVTQKLALPAIFVIALALRLHNLGFGLPSLYDPDEPLFVIKAVELLTDRTLNPNWFGHPGTTTIYLTALVSIVVVLGGQLTGSWNNVEEFTRAAFADPGLLFLPARFAMVLFAVACVGLTYRIGRRLHGTNTGLIAAALLAVNSLHVNWSQVIRTDINASLFMLVALWFSVGIAQTGRLRDYLCSGILTGVAIATKWPAASIFVAVIGAAVLRSGTIPQSWPAEARKLLLASIATVVALVLTSPFLILDWQTVVADLSGEARPTHLGHGGHGFWGNLFAYVRFQVAGSMGWIAVLLIAAGLTISSRNSPAARSTLLPATVAFLATISAQHLIWSRWMLPVMPMLAIYVAVAIGWLLDRTSALARPTSAIGGAALLLLSLLPSLINTFRAIRERENDTRAMAAEWALRHIPAGSTVAVEHLELRLRHQNWKILFPFGEVGCIDGVAILRGGIRYDDINRERNGAPIVDLGNIPRGKLNSCKADFSILSYYDLYRAEAASFPSQFSTYQSLLDGGKTVAVFRPEPGRVGGPVIRIVARPRR